MDCISDIDAPIIISDITFKQMISNVTKICSKNQCIVIVTGSWTR